MERRKKEDTTDRKVLYQKTGGGTLVLRDGSVIPGVRRGEAPKRFRALPEDVPEAFSDTVKRLEEPKVVEPDLVDKTNYEIRSKGNGWFEVVEVETGKVMHDGAKRAEEAKEILASLEE